MSIDDKAQKHVRTYRVTFTVDLALADAPVYRSDPPELFKFHQNALYEALVATPDLIRRFCLEEARVDVDELVNGEFGFEEISARLGHQLPKETLKFLASAAREKVFTENVEPSLHSTLKTIRRKVGVEQLEEHG